MTQVKINVTEKAIRDGIAPIGALFSYSVFTQLRPEGHSGCSLGSQAFSVMFVLLG
jgi:hypothetical protein